MAECSDKLRVMWLLNHRTARTFDVKMLRSVGVDEVFVPKSFPVNSQWVSADVDWSLDSHLTIPPDELATLNSADWYGNAGRNAWDIANRYFKIAIIGFHFGQVDDVTRHFTSTIVLRAWGHLWTSSFYSDLLYGLIGISAVNRIREMGNRFWFAESYEHLHEIEHEFLSRRRCYLPLGLPDATLTNKWRGHDPKIFFVCPQIGTEPYYREQYTNFIKNFSDLPYAIGGAQPIKVPDVNVLGFVPREEHAEHMRRYRVMFYPGAHHYHIHYHPFEAIRAGMPLVFMGGGLLDRLGGDLLPGRCRTVKEAHQKIQRLLSGDDRLLGKIRETQSRLLEKMNPSYCEPFWHRNFPKIIDSLKRVTITAPSLSRRRPKIAVIVPVGYRGGTLRTPKLIATALYLGSRQAGEPADVVLGHIDDPSVYTPDDFRDLHDGIRLRPYRWELLDQNAAERVLRYAGQENTLGPTQYATPNDGINYFLDCDVWVIVSDRMSVPVLPVRPCVFMIFDYIQRYVDIMPQGSDLPFLEVARAGAAVLVRTQFTRTDAAQYAGIHPKSIRLVPPLCPIFDNDGPRFEHLPPYFLWHTNPSPHKNHFNSISALRLYYEQFDGSFKCRISGVDSHLLFSGKVTHLESATDIWQSNRALQDNLIVMGEMPDSIYRKYLASARFLWHSVIVDDGTLAAVEAVSLGVPVLSTDYPPMRELDAFYDLNCSWCDALDPNEMASQLKRMEVEAEKKRATLPNHKALELKGVEHVANSYWEAVREWL